MLVRIGPEGGVLELRLARPQALNALTLVLVNELVDAVAAAHTDDAVRVVLLTAEGRAFCAGKDRDDPASEEFVAALQQLARTFMNCPKPVVAAVQGWAVGAGAELLLNCDIVVAARSARFMFPEINVGLFGTGGVVALLPRKVGLARAKGALMLGEAFSAQQALDGGMVWTLADDDGLAPAARAIAGKLAASDAALLAQLKSLLHEETFGSLDAVLAREGAAHRHVAARVAASAPRLKY